MVVLRCRIQVSGLFIPYVSRDFHLVTTVGPFSRNTELGACELPRNPDGMAVGLGLGLCIFSQLTLPTLCLQSTLLGSH